MTESAVGVTVGGVGGSGVLMVTQGVRHQPMKSGLTSCVVLSARMDTPGVATTRAAPR